jgi:hypothetical protein
VSDATFRLVTRRACSAIEESGGGGRGICDRGVKPFEVTANPFCSKKKKWSKGKVKDKANNAVILDKPIL